MDLDVPQRCAQTLIVLMAIFLADARARTGFDLHTEAAAVAESFQPKQRVTELMCLGQFAQLVVRRMDGAEQPVQAIDLSNRGVFAAHDLWPEPCVICNEPNRVQVPQSAQADVEQGAVGFDQVCLQQQRPDFACGLNEVNPTGLGDHLRFVRRAQVSQHARANVYALTDVQGQGALAPEDVHPDTTWQSLQAGGVDD